MSDVILFIMSLMNVGLICLLLLGINPIDPIRQDLICIGIADYDFNKTMECFK